MFFQNDGRLKLPPSPQKEAYDDLFASTHKMQRRPIWRIALTASVATLLLVNLVWASLLLQPNSIPRCSTNSLSGKHALYAVKTEERHEYWRDNLLPDLNYIIGGPIGGTANQIYALTNLLTLAHLTKRVAIVNLEPGWVKKGWPRYSEFWDIERFTRDTGIPVLEIDEIRANEDSLVKPEADRIGCWSTQEVHNGETLHYSALDHHRVPMDRWPLPDSVKLQPEWNGEAIFDALRLFDLQRNARDQWLETLRGPKDEVESLLTSTSGRHAPVVNATEPDDQLLCFDNYFNIHAAVAHSPAFGIEGFLGAHNSWNVVGRHLHWTSKVEVEVDRILTRSLGSSSQPFVAIHLRRGDFGKERSLQSYADALEELYSTMQASDEAGTAARKLPVFAVTDETDADFRASLSEMGWHQYDHVAMGTAESLGPWWPSIIDAALPSRALGVVGTGGSTYSLQIYLRALSWQNAAVAWVG